eukprot:765017-Hanusia_phi.AAC.3
MQGRKDPLEMQARYLLLHIQSSKVDKRIALRPNGSPRLVAPPNTKRPSDDDTEHCFRECASEALRDSEQGLPIRAANGTAVTGHIFQYFKLWSMWFRMFFLSNSLFGASFLLLFPPEPQKMTICLTVMKMQPEYRMDFISQKQRKVLEDIQSGQFEGETVHCATTGEG